MNFVISTSQPAPTIYSPILVIRSMIKFHALFEETK